MEFLKELKDQKIKVLNNKKIDNDHKKDILKLIELYKNNHLKTIKRG